MTEFIIDRLVFAGTQITNILMAILAIYVSLLVFSIVREAIGLQGGSLSDDYEDRSLSKEDIDRQIKVDLDILRGNTKY